MDKLTAKNFLLVVCFHQYKSNRWSSINNIPWYIQYALVVWINLGQFNLGLVI